MRYTSMLFFNLIQSNFYTNLLKAIKMKKVIFVSVAFCFSMCLFAQTDSTKKKMQYIDNEKRQMTREGNYQTATKLFPDGVMMKNGKLMMIKNGKKTLMDHEMSMSNGTKVLSNGMIMKKDGTKMMMKEGQYMNMAGNFRNPETKKVITKKTTTKETNNNKKKDMYLMQNEKIKKDSLK